MRRFADAGYEVFHDADRVSGEIVVVNTCGFIGDAKEESIEMILQLAEAKKRRRIGKLFPVVFLRHEYGLTMKLYPPLDKLIDLFRDFSCVSVTQKLYAQVGVHGMHGHVQRRKL